MFLLLRTYRVNKFPSLPPSFLSYANNEHGGSKEGGFCASENFTISPNIGVVRVFMHSKNKNLNQDFHRFEVFEKEKKIIDL